jgi:hypothetical protein
MIWVSPIVIIVINTKIGKGCFLPGIRSVSPVSETVEEEVRQWKKKGERSLNNDNHCVKVQERELCDTRTYLLYPHKSDRGKYVSKYDVFHYYDLKPHKLCPEFTSC